METKTTNKEEIIRHDIGKFAKENNFTKMSLCVLHNVNGYPYIMFFNPKDKDIKMGLYFSKNAAKMVAKDQPVTKQLLSSLSVVETKNSKGEERFKLSIAHLDIEELLGE